MSLISPTRPFDLNTHAATVTIYPSRDIALLVGYLHPVISNHDNLVSNYSSLNNYWVSKIRRPLSGDGDDRLFVVPNFTLLSFSHIKRKRWSPVCCDLLLSIWLHAFATFLYVHLRHLVGEYCRRKKRKHERLFQSSSFDVTLSYIHGSFIFIIQQQYEWKQNIKRSTSIR